MSVPSLREPPSRRLLCAPPRVIQLQQAQDRLFWDQNRVLLLADGAEGQKQLAHWLPLLANVTRKQGRATAYICENYVGNLPTADPQTAAHVLDGTQIVQKYIRCWFKATFRNKRCAALARGSSDIVKRLLSSHSW